MYLEHFGFSQLPFHLTPNTELFLGLAPHYEAIQTVNAALKMGEGVIKVTGEVGTGKTMVCRMLVNHFEPNIQLVYLPNPALSGSELRQSVAAELMVHNQNVTSIVDDIQHRLIELTKAGKQVVVLVDEAQALSDDALEVLRLFGNLETERQKLLQIVLFGQPELDERLVQHHLRQFRQRITFSAKLRPLSIEETVTYINTRLEKAGGSGDVFTLSQKKAVWRASRGIPRLINQLCHKSLLLASSQGVSTVQHSHLHAAAHDTFDACKPKYKSPMCWGWS
ncbi:MSHA biogenesis protein MshM [Vibrio ichthyoenteri ATCC 700023]|uniref:MSHA biogenesis protein MshM n=1 Tax=Vibrio ichthyoenteri ATCC 700023 TaxID=870968 RepID=F9S1H2_9VIBR|nr:AAA family ATPase [Vibrio ichthyoenteri]EGU41678.1 MSHA biogenesis protein MshM [Vibrio ichthyoenteri ATCC 700023]